MQAEQICEFAGALVLHGMTRGIFATTGDLTKGARKTSNAFEHAGLRIELWNPTRLYDPLRVPRYERYQPFYAPHLDRARRFTTFEVF